MLVPVFPAFDDVAIGDKGGRNGLTVWLEEEEILLLLFPVFNILLRDDANGV